MDLLEAPLAIVDLETTGTRPAADRITEIGVLEIDRFQVRSEWSTLVNPGIPIPSEIQALTGINYDMLAAAPRFAELAGDLHERLAGRVFIAHNARFDYGFLRREFDRAGLKFQPRTVCSVKLSRRLYPGERGHDLDSLIARHGIACQARHRALGDADALWQFLRIAARDHGDEVLSVAARQVAKQPALPAQLERSQIDAVPEAPGVYLFYGETGAPLYIGKSRSMRSRILQHFYSTAAWLQEVRRIECHRTVGELGALLTEARLVKELSPAYNRQLRRPEAMCGFVFDGKHLRLATADEIDADTLAFVYGVFRSRRAALQALRALADEHGLCLQTLGFDAKRRGACFRHQIGRCAGVCAAREGIHAHHARVATALATLKTPAWPYAGAVGIVEEDRARDATEVHAVDRWCYLGAARCEPEMADLLDERPRFDYDHYRILSRHLAKPGVRVVPIAQCTASS
ncbi:MAG TPA: exonuclease domain-containing protein [Burkholderiales bacterium]|nr:exonuclease domain-containing protein [Burkholderiales bacterium]